MKEELKNIYSYHNWRQSINIDEKYSTPGHIKKNIWRWSLLPLELKNESFLDIGSNDGKVVFEAEKRGGNNIVACDLYIDDLRSMINGWPINGIEMLIKYKKSKVQIMRDGIFGLQASSVKYDHVLLNDVINWVGNIDETLMILANKSKKNIFISDQFLKSSQSIKVRPNSKELKMFNEMCSIHYVIEFLASLGFELLKSKKILPEEVDFDSYIASYKIYIDKEVAVYAYPDKHSPQNNVIQSNQKSSYFVNGYFFIRSIGWVKKEDVISVKNHSSLLYKIFNFFNLNKLYFYLTHKKRNEVVNYSMHFIKK